MCISYREDLINLAVHYIIAHIFLIFYNEYPKSQPCIKCKVNPTAGTTSEVCVVLGSGALGVPGRKADYLLHLLAQNAIDEHGLS